MTEALGDLRDDATPELERLYRRWSDGGAGLLISGHLQIDSRFLEQAGNVVLDDETDEAALRAWVAAGTHGGNHFWAQLNHPGRQTTRFHTDRPVAPSAVPLRVRGFFARPRALEDSEIALLIAAFARSVAIARRAGFTGVHVHAAHGYLISQFLSPRTNRRHEAWGGPLTYRARFLLEVVRAVRAEVGHDFPHAVKLNSSYFQGGGFEHRDAIEVARLLAAEGIDLLEISGGTYERVVFAGNGGRSSAGDGPGAFISPRSAATRAREAFFLDYTRAIRDAMTGVPLMVTGGFRTPAFMAQVLRNGEADVLGIARPFCVEPGFPARLLAGSPDPLPSPEGRIRIGPAGSAPTVRPPTCGPTTPRPRSLVLPADRAPRRRPGARAATGRRHPAAAALPLARAAAGTTAARVARGGARPERGPARGLRPAQTSITRSPSLAIEHAAAVTTFDHDLTRCPEVTTALPGGRLDGARKPPRPRAS